MDCPQREWAFLGSSHGFSVLLKRNCSISPIGMIAAFAALAVVTLGIGFGFAVAGAWLVLPFAGLEVAGLVLAFFWTVRHAADYERIDVAPGRVCVELAEGRVLRRHELDSRAVRVRLADDGQRGTRVLLTNAGAGEIEVGRHLDVGARLGLAGELKKSLSL